MKKIILITIAAIYLSGCQNEDSSAQISSLFRHHEALELQNFKTPASESPKIDSSDTTDNSHSYTNTEKNFQIQFPDTTKVSFVKWDNDDLELKLCFDEEISDCETSIGGGDTILVKTYPDIEKNIKIETAKDLYKTINEYYPKSAPLQHPVLSQNISAQLETFKNRTWYLTKETDIHGSYTVYHFIAKDHLYMFAFNIKRSQEHMQSVLNAFSTIQN